MLDVNASKSSALHCTTRSVYPVVLHVRGSLMFPEWLHDIATRGSRRVATPFRFARDTARLRQMDNRPRCVVTRGGKRRGKKKERITGGESKVSFAWGLARDATGKLVGRRINSHGRTNVMSDALYSRLPSTFYRRVSSFFPVSRRSHLS